MLDGVGAASVGDALASARIGGHVVSYGAASGLVPPVAMEQLAARSLTLSRPGFGHYAGTPGQSAGWPEGSLPIWPRGGSTRLRPLSWRWNRRHWR